MVMTPAEACAKYGDVHVSPPATRSKTLRSPTLSLQATIYLQLYKLYKGKRHFLHSMGVQKLPAALLRRQDDVCSSAVIRLLVGNAAFNSLAAEEGDAIVRRDSDDERKLAVGIRIAIHKGLLKAHPNVSPVRKINVEGLTAQDVTDFIVKHLPSTEGNVIVLQGLSGTGKGTTVSKLKAVLPRCMTWSNGNVFRSYTYLCNCELKARGQSISKSTLTPELICQTEKRITFEQCEDGIFRVLLDGKQRVEDIQNTILKDPLISAMVPTVAEETQGEVIRFASAAVQKLSTAGYNVILEGREQTLQYIPTEQRFELVIPRASLLGERRAAQRVMAKALEILASDADDSEEAAASCVVKAVETL